VDRISAGSCRAAAAVVDFGAGRLHHPPQVGATDQDPVMEEPPVETAVGIALIIISALEIVWITRTVTANTPR
jgi:hypothetical protein